MALNITITEILGRAEQGMTRPFFCREKFLLYYAKGKYAGQRSLCCEWLAGNLANHLLAGLPMAVPPFTIATVPTQLIEASARADIGDLGPGPVFASMRIEEAQEMNWTTAQNWPLDTMATLLLLDLWLQNEDRSLSAAGGNPNLLLRDIPPLRDSDPEAALWSDQPRRTMLWVYDFNLAFDEHFDRERFFQSHVFGSMLQQWPVGFRERMEKRMAEALVLFPQWLANLPAEWRYLDGDDTLPVQLDSERVFSLLNLPFTRPDDFWALP